MAATKRRGSGWTTFRRGDPDKRVPEAGTGCLLWGGAINNRGYGSLRVGNRVVKAHRYWWERENGTELLYTEELDHTCNTRRCANPAHLEVVRRDVNVRRSFNRGRRATEAKKLEELARFQLALAAATADVPF
jgi:hypothetical protein